MTVRIRITIVEAEGDDAVRAALEAVGLLAAPRRAAPAIPAPAETPIPEPAAPAPAAAPAKNRRRDEPDPHDDEIRRLYVDEGLSQPKIAKRLGIPRIKIRRRLRDLGVPMRSISESMRPASAGTTAEHDAEIRRLYLDAQLGSGQIASAMGLRASHVNNRLRALGVPRRSMSEAMALVRRLARASGADPAKLPAPPSPAGAVSPAVPEPPAAIATPTTALAEGAAPHPDKPVPVVRRDGEEAAIARHLAEKGVIRGEPKFAAVSEQVSVHDAAQRLRALKLEEPTGWRTNGKG